ncbi:MAG: hemolysin-type calcium-binding repeat family protein [Rhizobium sp.]|nr:hemolysin-type calcium-binding repeat family protein [Rhizobium sp.]
MLDKNASIKFDGAGALLEDVTHAFNRFVIKGTIEGGHDFSDSGMYIRGEKSEVTIARSGDVSGYSGVRLAGYSPIFTNHGTVSGDAYGVYCDDDAVITNDGRISGTFAILLNDAGGIVTNESQGRIIASATAVELYSDDGKESALTNRGLIKGADAIVGQTANDIIVNRGVMKGGIDLGGGNDSFDNRGGSVNHNIVSGDGNDWLIVDDAKTQMVEKVGAGTDTVKSTVTYALSANVENLVLLGKADAKAMGNDENNGITGNAGDNVLSGKVGMDVLNGGYGNDLLTGGADADTFLLAKGGGHDVVADFVNGSDHIDLSGLDAIADFDDLWAHHLTVTENDVIIHAGGGRLTLHQTAQADLDFTDFYF